VKSRRRGPDPLSQQHGESHCQRDGQEKQAFFWTEKKKKKYKSFIHLVDWKKVEML